MTIPPRFMNVSELEQRARFREISAYCETHLSQAMKSVGGSPWSVTAAFDPVNRNRNRYSNVLPWDKTRVRVPCSSEGSDYTNASFVQLDSNKYIAAQGPTFNTVHHFWAMCFSQAVETNTLVVFIAMVTPLVEQNREKCFAYWPTKQQQEWDLSDALRAENLHPGHLKVTWLSENKNDGILLTKFRLESGAVAKTVYHYYYLEWRDTQVPDSVLPLFLLSKNMSLVKQTHPGLVPVVHCSAGVGRTGTFIAIDHFLNADLAARVDGDFVFDTVKTLRDHRMMMVQTVHQYRFLYQVAKEIFSARHTL